MDGLTLALLENYGITNNALGLITTNPGWTPEPLTWEFTIGKSYFTVGAGTGLDVTARYPVGTKLSCTDAASTKYFYVTGSAHLYGNPLVEDCAFSSSEMRNTYISFTGGSDYTLSGGAITNPMYSYMATPYGFPHWMNYTPTCTGWSGTPTTTGTKFRLSEGKISLVVNINGTSNQTYATMALPIASSSYVMQALNLAGDNGAAVAAPVAEIYADLSTLNFYTSHAYGAWVNSGNKYISGWHDHWASEMFEYPVLDWETQ